MYAIKPVVDGMIMAEGNDVSLVVNEGKAFMRVASRMGEGEVARWLVAELDGVRVYIDRAKDAEQVRILVTKSDIYP